MSNADVIFGSMLNSIKNDGIEVSTRNSITKRLVGLRVEFDSTPLISVRKTAWRNAILEMEWFLSGSSNINDLDPKVHSWWKPWADANGDVLNNYSKQFRHYGSGLDQMAFLVDAVKNHPFSRRNIITTWNTEDMINPLTPITNCHGSMIQTFVDNNNKLDILMYQRSSDMVLGLPHNLIQYWALLLWLAKQAGREVGKFVWVGGDCHLYKDHYDVADKIIAECSSITNTSNLIYTGNVGDTFKASDFKLDSEYSPLITDKVRMIV